MNFVESFKERVEFINDSNFDESAKELFEYQFHTNEIYKYYCNNLKKHPSQIKNIEEIPFIPIEIFKTHEIKSGNWKTKKVFLSSGTTGQNRSFHHFPI